MAAASEIGLRRLASQRISSRRLARPADVVRSLGAVQAQDYQQSLWAIGARMRRGTAAAVERAIEDRAVVRTWLMRGTIHFAAPEDVRPLLALCAPRLATAEARRRKQLGLTAADLERGRQALRDALAGDRRLSRPECMQVLAAARVDTTGQRGYHILSGLARDGVLCLGPMQGRQPTFVLLDDWVPRADEPEPTREATLAALASRFVAGRGPVTDQDLARWAGLPLGDARTALRAGEHPAQVTRSLDGTEYWVAAGQERARVPRSGRARAYILAGFDEFVLGYGNRDAQLPPEHSHRVVPGANGIFKPLVVAGGQVVGTWAKSVRAGELTVTLHPFTANAPGLARAVADEVARYRDFLGLAPAGAPAVRVGEPC
jgi:winged helix DNA-binding protein